jgi:hypothetical protein
MLARLSGHAIMRGLRDGRVIAVDELAGIPRTFLE